MTLIAFGAALGGFLFGHDTSTMNAAVNGIRDSLHITFDQVGFNAAISLIGAALFAWKVLFGTKEREIS